MSVIVALFGGHRKEHQIDFLVLILIGIVTVSVWAVGVGFFAYRLFVVHEGASRGTRWAIGVPALIVWTVGLVVVADWVVD